ncbi:MAG: hypothetical protein U0234_33575 [Sandaracinus sp.]
MSIDEDDLWLSRAAELVGLVGPSARVAIVVRDGKLIAQAVQRGGDADVTALTLACPRGRDGTLYLAQAPGPHSFALARRVGIRRMVLAAHVTLVPAELERWASLGSPSARAEEIAA